MDEIYLPGSIENLSERELEKKRVYGSIGTEVIKNLTDYFLKNSFQWLLPVVFSYSTDPLWPDPGASIEKRIEVEIYGKRVRTTQSMIVHKIVACSLVYEKIFVLSPNVRIERRERAKTGRHLYEFTQLDFESRNAGSKQIMDLVENAMVHLKNKLLENPFAHDRIKKIRRPFKIYDMNDLENEFGKSWEDVLPREIDNPVWVVNIPREFYDFQDFETGRWDNYDLYLPGIGEVLSGARREFEYEKLVKKMERDNVNKENYRVLLDLSKSGRIKPTAGAGIGIERLISWIVHADHVGDVQLFPRVPGMVYDL